MLPEPGWDEAALSLRWRWIKKLKVTQGDTQRAVLGAGKWEFCALLCKGPLPWGSSFSLCPGMVFKLSLRMECRQVLLWKPKPASSAPSTLEPAQMDDALMAQAVFASHPNSNQTEINCTLHLTTQQGLPDPFGSLGSV